MIKNLIKLQFQVDRMRIQERAGISAGVVGAILLLWVFIFYFPQTKTAASIQGLINSEQIQTKNFEEKRQTIESLASDNTLQKLNNKHERLQKKMKQLNEKISRYEQRYIGEKELAQLLYSLLEKTEGVRILDFSNIDYKKGFAPEEIDTTTLISSATSSVSSKQKKVLKEKPKAEDIVDIKQLPSTRIQYKLVLEGKYFAVMQYLKYLEALDWQLYWDKLNYTVDNYPQAIVTIEFYTLQPSDQESSQEAE